MNNFPSKEAFRDILNSEEYQKEVQRQQREIAGLDNVRTKVSPEDISKSPLELLKEAEKKIRIKCIDLFLIGVLVGMMIMQLLILVVKMQN